MLESLENKLKENINCELTIEELKALYESNDETLIDYIEKRDKYSDLCKIYGKKSIARTKEEITEDTICYIGNLDINEKLPTYNLKFIYGDLSYAFDEVYNLENLEKIHGNAYFNHIVDAEGLENLRLINGAADFNELKNAEGLSSLEKIMGSVIFKSLISAEGLDNLNFIGGFAHFDNLKSAKGLENLSCIGGSAYFDNLKSADGLNNLEKINDDAYFIALKSAKGLDNLKYIGKDAQFYQLEYIKEDELNQLQTIGNSACFQMAKRIDGLKKLHFIGEDAYFKTLENGSGLENLESINGDAHFESLKNASLLQNLKLIKKDAYFNSLFDALGLDKLEVIEGSAHFESLLSTQHLDNLKTIGCNAWFNNLNSIYDLNLKIKGDAYFSYLSKEAIMDSSILILGEINFQKKFDLKISDITFFSNLDEIKGFTLAKDIDNDILTYNSKIVDDNNLFKKLFNRKYRTIEKSVSGGSILSNKYALYREDSKKIISLCKGLNFNGKKIQIDPKIFGTQIINSLKFITSSEKKYYFSELNKCEDNESAIKVINAAMDAESEQCENILNYFNSKRKNNRIKGYNGKQRKIKCTKRYTNDNSIYSEISSFDDIYRHYKKLPGNSGKKGSKDKKRQDFILYRDYLRELSHLIEITKNYNFDLDDLYECYDTEKLILVLIKKTYDMIYDSIVKNGYYDPKFKPLFDNMINCFKIIDKYKEQNNSYNLYIYTNEEKNEFLDYDTLKSSMINLMLQFPDYNYELILDIFPKDEIPFVPFASDAIIPLSEGTYFGTSKTVSNGGFDRKESLRYLLSKNPVRIIKVENLEFEDESFKNYTGFVYRGKEGYVTIFEKCPIVKKVDGELVYEDVVDNATYAMNVDTKYSGIDEKINSSALSKTQIIISNREESGKKIANRFYHRSFTGWKKKMDKIIGSDSIQLTGGSKINIKTSDNNKSKTLKK